jgi:hypothetical protein
MRTLAAPAFHVGGAAGAEYCANAKQIMQASGQRSATAYLLKTGTKILLRVDLSRLVLNDIR